MAFVGDHERMLGIPQELHGLTSLQVTGSAAGVLNDLSTELRWIHDPEMKADLRRILQAHGWNGPDPQPHPDRPPGAAAYQKLVMFLARWFRVAPATITGFAFRDDATALRYALKYPRRAQNDADHLAILEAEASD